MTHVYHATADASETYTPHSGIDIARTDGAAAQGNVASFSRDNTLVFSSVVYVPLYAPRARTSVLPQYVQRVEEEFEMAFLPR